MSEGLEDKIVALQICIADGHSYELDKEAIEGDCINLECSVCGYVHTVLLTADQAKAIDEMFDSENKLLAEILKNDV